MIVVVVVASLFTNFRLISKILKIRLLLTQQLIQFLNFGHRNSIFDSKTSFGVYFRRMKTIQANEKVVIPDNGK